MPADRPSPARRARLQWLLGAALLPVFPGGCVVRPPRPSAVVAPTLSSTPPVPTLPPPKTQPFPLRNAGFEAEPLPDGRLQGWYFVQHAGPQSYEFGLDGERPREGRRCLRISNVGKEPYGLAAQRLDVVSLRGRTIVFSGAIRTTGVTGDGAGLTVRVEQGSNLLAHDFMLDRLVRGETDWQRIAIEIAVDARATHLELGVMLQGPGTLWFDDARLDVRTA